MTYKIGDESIMMLQIAEWIKQKTDLWDSYFHFPNEGRLSWQAGKFQKRIGVTSGVLDIFLSRSNDWFKGLWIEIKVPGKVPTKEQFKFMSDRILEGYDATWFDDVNKSITYIKHFYSI